MRYRLLNRDTFGQFARDFLPFGNASLGRTPNMLSRDLGMRHSLAKYMRRASGRYTNSSWRASDSGNTGEAFTQGRRDILGEHATVQVAKRSELPTFRVLPKRCIGERRFAWGGCVPGCISRQWSLGVICY